MPRRWRLPPGALAFIVLALFAGLPGAALADLFVSDLFPGEVRRFTPGGVPIPPTPFSLNGGEGIACLTAAGTSKLFVAKNGQTINVFDVATGQKLAAFVTLGPSARIAALSLSLDGALLYAADYGTDTLYAFNTSNATVAHTAVTSASHDVRVGPDGNVYATNFLLQTGVLKFNPDLTPFSTPTFVANNDNGLIAAGAMTFDTAGNLWVSDFSGSSTVFEYGAAGNFLRKVTDPLLHGPFGLDVGPDGNIYVAVFFGDIVAKIDVANNFSVSTFIPKPDAGIEPKYLAFSCTGSAPVSQGIPTLSGWTFILLGLVLAWLGVASVGRRLASRIQPR